MKRKTIWFISALAAVAITVLVLAAPGGWVRMPSNYWMRGDLVCNSISVGADPSVAVAVQAAALSGITPGTAAASKAVILDANKSETGLGTYEWDGATSGGIKIAPIGTGTNLTTIQNSAGGSAKVITLPAATGTIGTLENAENVTGAKTFSKLNAITGAAGIAGTATMASGTVTVSTTAVTANSIIVITPTATRATTSVCFAVGTISAGTSFTIEAFVAAGTAASADSTSVVNWQIIN